MTIVKKKFIEVTPSVKRELAEFKDMSLSRICEIIVEEQAPEFYLLPDTAMDIFIAERDKRRKNRLYR